MRSMLFRVTLWGFVLPFCVLQVLGRVMFRERLPEDRSAFTHTDVDNSATPTGGQRRLIVLFHGMSGPALTDVRTVIRDTYPEGDVLAPGYSASALSNEDPLNMVREYLAAIDDATTAKHYDHITFVGYSLGALLARKALVCAYTGCVNDYDGIERQRMWRSRVDRVVLLAGMNRGWATHCEKVVAVEQAAGVGYDNDCRASRMRWSQWMSAELGQRFGPAFGVGGLFLSVQRGRPFVANLRLEWLALQQGSEQVPPVIQLLGDIDEVVSRSDNLDQFVTGNFVFLQLRRTNHADVVKMTGPDGQERKRKFTWALTWPIEKLREANELLSSPDYQPDASVRRVVMIVHGIRDDGRWAQDLGKELEKADPNLRAFSRSYGYFSALYFLMPTRMGANVQWFVDQYTQLRALYPSAEFSFVGHSNGTYMLAQSLAEYHAVNFKRVVFAGSVVPTGFPWSQFKNRIGGIRNYRASNDIVVAALPSVFEYVRGFLRVGGAGHAGFTDEFARLNESRFFAAGGHGAVLGNRENYPSLVNYVLETGDCLSAALACEAYELPTKHRTDRQSLWAVFLFKFSVLVWLAAIFLIGLAAYATSRAVRPNRPQRSKQGYFLRSSVAGFAVLGMVLAVLRYI